MRLLLATLFALGAFAGTASACSCAAGDPGQEVAAADAAVDGVVLGVTGDRPYFTGPYDSSFELRVFTDYKDNVGQVVSVRTPQGTSCSLTVRPGDRLGLLLDRENGEFVAGACSVRSPEDLQRGRDNPPRPATPALPPVPAPPTFLVGDRTGIDVLDGAFARLGRVDVGAEQLVTCPGGVTALALRGRELLTIEGTAVVAARTVPAGVRRIDCRSADPADPLLVVRRGRRVRVQRASGATLWRGRASSVVFGVGTAYAATRTRLLAIGLADGRVRRRRAPRSDLRLLAADASGVLAARAGRRVVLVDRGRVIRGPRSSSTSAVPFGDGPWMISGAIIAADGRVVARVPPGLLHASGDGVGVVSGGALRVYTADGQVIAETPVGGTPTTFAVLPRLSGRRCPR